MRRVVTFQKDLKIELKLTKVHQETDNQHKAEIPQSSLKCIVNKFGMVQPIYV